VTDDSPQWLLLDRYLAGELTPAEREQFEQWMALVPARWTWVESLRTITRETSTSRPSCSASTDAAWRRATQRLRIAPGKTVGHKATTRSSGDRHAPRTVRARSWRGSIGMVQSRAGLFIAGALAASVAVVALAIVGSDHDRARPAHRFATNAGEQVGVTLSDGTSMVLAPASVLTVRSGFGRSAREVTLDGEASFTVTHDARLPFTIHTSWAVLRDVGTTFVVRAYQTDRGTLVAVREGAVSVASPGAPTAVVTLGARAAASIDGQGRLHVGGVTDADALLAWMRGRTVFNAVPLGDVVRDLSREFDLEILVPDSPLARLPVTASFAEEPVEAILDDITAIVGARYTRAGRTIVIRRKAKGGASSTVRAPPSPRGSTAVTRRS
jgi:ferric-dicitrate binding protein FerR (iron transport regulator)